MTDPDHIDCPEPRNDPGAVPLPPNPWDTPYGEPAAPPPVPWPPYPYADGQPATGADVARQAVTRASTDERYRSLQLADLRGLEMPELDYLVAGLVPRGALILFSGREKEGKSLALLDAAAAVAAGEPWAGRTTVPGRVVYCPAEDSLRTVRDRLRRRLGETFATDGRPLTIIPLTGELVAAGHMANRLDLNQADMMAAFRQAVTHDHDGPPALIILDCLRELHSGRENESDDMTVTMRPLRQLAHELNAAIIVVHHASKGAVASSRGSTAIAAACDAVATWTGHGEQGEQGMDGARREPGRENASGVTTEPLRVTLTIRGRDVPKTTIRLEMSADLRFHPVAGEHAGRGTPDHILRVLQDGLWRTAAEIAQVARLPVQTVKNTLTTMLGVANPAIARTGAGHRYDPYCYRRVPTVPATASQSSLSLVVKMEEAPGGADAADGARASSQRPDTPGEWDLG